MILLSSDLHADSRGKMLHLQSRACFALQDGRHHLPWLLDVVLPSSVGSLAFWALAMA